MLNLKNSNFLKKVAIQTTEKTIEVPGSKKPWW